jgi:hypothetical protein
VIQFEETIPQGLKPGEFLYDLLARLKSCPDASSSQKRLFRKYEAVLGYPLTKAHQCGAESPTYQPVPFKLTHYHQTGITILRMDLEPDSLAASALFSSHCNASSLMLYTLLSI